MDKEEGVKLLLRGYDDNDILERHKDTAETIINRLGKLALAIDQAAAYIKYKRMPLDRLEDFLTTYETKRLEILKHTPRKFWEYQKVQDEGKPEHSSAFTTWELSFQQLRSGDEPWKNVEAHFLSLSAFFAPTAITESIFRHYQEEHDSEIAWLQMFSKTGEVQDDKIDNKGDEAGNQSFDKGLHGIWDPDRFWDVIVTSEELSLLQSIAPGTDQQGATFSLHPLIRDWLQLRLQPKERGNFAHEAIAALACCVKAFETRSTSLEEKTALITHIDVSMSNDKEFSTSQDRLCHDLASCDLAFWFGQFYIDRGRYHTSEELCRRMVETRRKLLSEKHPLTLRDMDNLARVLSIQCKYEEALSIFRQTSTLREATLGDKHVDTLESKNSLALVLMARGRYAESEQIVRQTLIRNTLIQGEEHPSTLMSMRVLALVLRGQRKFEEAERVCRTLSRLRLKVWGEEHVSTLSTMGLLAVSLLDQKKYEEAEPLFQQALRLSEKLSGRENPNTLIYMNYLARLLKGQLKYEEAERLFQQTFKLREKVLGREHPDTLMSMYGLAEVLKDQLKYEEAERLFQQTFKLREKVLGKEHPNTLMSMYGLAEILKDQLKYEEAERLFQQILKLREKVLGKEHPDTLMSMCGLAEILKDQLKYEEAERLFQQILKLREKVLGTKHSDTVGSMGSMGSLEMVLRRRGKDEEAERLSPGNAS